MKIANCKTAADFRKCFGEGQDASPLLAFISMLPPEVGEVTKVEGMSPQKGRFIRESRLAVSLPGLRAFYQSLPQGQQREAFVALHQTISKAASLLSPMEYGHVAASLRGTRKDALKFSPDPFKPGQTLPREKRVSPSLSFNDQAGEILRALETVTPETATTASPETVTPETATLEKKKSRK